MYMPLYYLFSAVFFLPMVWYGFLAIEHLKSLKEHKEKAPQE
ncbi:hypothetical protein SAMN06296036_13349 [Pseudobacteriovorax antillogorgiicola]|uniref:Uncharacterized protein n=1 Tax=Pseudobacteriovorax antillogorgiicola TaxID=1513793 RepID=A0A1Y6CN78_9BACT|nr:hypothetical protein EDD56_13325 [Pseudobacteriovorax antillogorgiicola]SMF79279.1 hypothetical protein SAMN06296036_13349 [Pseudobacteriovorax antillogorgiicola]